MTCTLPNIVFADGSGDKKAATGAGADFNICECVQCYSVVHLCPPPLPSLLPPSHSPSLSPTLSQHGGFGRGKPMSAGLGAPS